MGSNINIRLHRDVHVNRLSPLLSSEDNWVASAGIATPGQLIMYGKKKLFLETRGWSWMQLLLYGITGRVFNEKQIKLFEGIWSISTSYPDPRIWNNRVAALAGTTRSTGNLGLSAAIAISEANIYGQRPVIRSIDFLLNTKSKLDKGYDLNNIIKSELKTHRTIPGYGRPMVSTDERITPLNDLAKNLGFEKGYYVQLAFKIEETLVKGRWRFRMNVAALIAALVADQGLNQSEHYQFMILCFTAGILPCYLEGARKNEGTFLPIRCSRINYQGQGKRPWSD